MSQAVELHVKIVRFVLDHQPPIVGCEVVDADGKRHTFIDKVSLKLLMQLANIPRLAWFAAWR